MEGLIILEYKESEGQWHYNMVNNGIANNKPDTFGWESIALTEEDKARIFTNMMDCKLHRREALNQPPYTSDFIKKEWKHFCYVFNCIIEYYEITPERKDLVDRFFNHEKTLGRLGNGHFLEDKEAYDLPWAWEYDPLNFKESNF